MTLFGITEQGFSKIHMGARPEIWAYGVRNPYAFRFDKKTGSMFIADVGQNHLEEIDWQPADSKGGQNYGWKHNMGTKCHPITGRTTSARSSARFPSPSIRTRSPIPVLRS